jgi:transposase
MKGDILLSRKEIHRLQVLEKVMGKIISLRTASQHLELSYRQAKRLWSRFKTQGAAGLAHLRRGKSSPRALSPDLRQRILNLFQTSYFDFNTTHFTEMLLEREHIAVSRESVRSILRAAHIPPKKRHRPPRFRRRRTPKPQFGMLLQWDGSPHPWFGPQHPPCCLMAAIDDATSKLIAAFFTLAESSEAYLRLLDRVLQKFGTPLAIYHDRHGSLVRTDNFWSLEEQLQGFQYPTHVGRVLQVLHIQSISALSPQAKGRVERLFGVLQDRLIAELRLQNIDSIEKANPWLESFFIHRFNRRFAKSPSELGSAFTPISYQERFRLVSYAYEAVVANDNTVRLGGLVIDIPPTSTRRSFAKKTVLARQHLDGSWSVWDGNFKIASHASTPFTEPIRSWKHKASGKDNLKALEALQVYIQSKPAPLPG